MKKFIIEKSRDNFNIFKVIENNKGRYIGSKYNQQKEIDKLIESFRPFTEKDIYVVFGLGFGEHIKELLEKNNFKNEILIIDIMKNLAEDKNIKNIIENERVTLGKGIEEVKSFFRKNVNDFNVDWVKIGYYGKYDLIFKAELSNILEFIRDEFYLRISNKNTNIYFSERWYETLMKNLKYIVQAIPVNSLEDSHKNKPAVIVSAGPSLDKNIKELTNKNNLLILSGGRTLKTLLENNISPTVLGVVDPGEVSYGLVENYIEESKCPLLFYEGTNEKVVDKHKGEKIFYTNNDFIRKIFKEKIVDFALGGSIAHALTAFAAYIGCNPIIFVGQDLAYTEEKYYSDSLSRKTFNKVNEDEHFFYVDDIYGNKVKTSPMLNDFKIVLEEIIKLFPKIHFINATEGGANINGTEIKTLEEALKKLDKEKLEFKVIKEINETIKNNAILELSSSVKVFKELKSICKKGVYLLEDFLENYNKDKHKTDKILKELESIDKKIRAYMDELHIVKNLIFSQVNILENNLQFVVSELDNKDEIFNKNINKNKAIYKLIYGVLDYSEPMLEETIKELINENKGD